MQVMPNTKDVSPPIEEHDAFDSYFECITTCSWVGGEDAECVTRCMEVHLNEDALLNK